MSHWLLIRVYYNLLLFLFLIYCLPMAKNIYFIILIEGFLLVVISVMSHHRDYTVPYGYLFKLAHFIWVLGEIFLIYSVFNLSRKDCRGTKQ